MRNMTEQAVIGVRQERISPAFKFFHATSANGTAMLISAVISSYFSVRKIYMVSQGGRE